ncbi:MAG TPA: DUF5652 family protein [Paludibacter sp.]|nr:DUF5652 family protein [Paludibacter sp.]
MERCEYLATTFWWLIPLVVALALWDIVWKVIGMWRAARNNELAWFICIAVFNTMGILPIIYLLLNRRKAGNP